MGGCTSVVRLGRRLTRSCRDQLSPKPEIDDPFPLTECPVVGVSCRRAPVSIVGCDGREAAVDGVGECGPIDVAHRSTRTDGEEATVPRGLDGKPDLEADPRSLDGTCCALEPAERNARGRGAG